MKTHIFFLLSHCFAAAIFVEYMRIPHNGFIWFAVCIVIYLLFIRKKISNSIGKVRIFCFFPSYSAYSLFLGYHIKTNFELYEGLMDSNYRTPYSINDLFALFFLTILWVLIFKSVFYCIKKISANISLTKNTGISNYKHWLIGALCLSAAWIPYFLIYYPGFIFGDSLASIFQALEFWGLSNHHPILYTFFIKGCLTIGMGLKDINLGCAIYTILQMLYISFILSYLVCWIRNKGISARICVGLMVFFAFVPFIPLNSIAMWKDPIFSASLALWTLLLFDFVLSNGTIIKEKPRFIPIYIITLLILYFSRNNVFLYCTFQYCCLYFYHSHKPQKKKKYYITQKVITEYDFRCCFCQFYHRSRIYPF